MIAIGYRSNPDSAIIRGGRISSRYGHRRVPKTGLDLICRRFDSRLAAVAYLSAAPQLAATGHFVLTEV